MGDSVRAGGRVVLSGILEEQVPEVVNTYLASGFTVDAVEMIREWATVTLVRGGCDVV
jgi:ribosomal protein L11 methylase PrmA